MRNSLSICVVVLLMASGCRFDGFPVNEERISVTIGQSQVELVIYDTNVPGYTYLCLHDNEDTSPEAVLEVMKRHGGRLVELQHSGARNISFEMGDTVYTFDPNRIFTEKGIEATLARLSVFTDEAAQAVRNFAGRILEELHLSEGEMIVAVHNNTEGEYSILSYAAGGEEETNARLVHLTDETRADDFFFVTHPALYALIQEGGFNVVLQDNPHVTDDGSLSVYSAQNGIPYINVEAQHGHFEEQVKMLEYLNRFDVTSVVQELRD